MINLAVLEPETPLCSSSLPGCLARRHAGPEAELHHWRRHTTRLHALAEQLAGAERRAVAALCAAAGAPACARWRDAERRLAEAAAEAKETVKYLTTLEGSLEPIYSSEAEGAGKLSIAWGSEPIQFLATGRDLSDCLLLRSK